MGGVESLLHTAVKGDELTYRRRAVGIDRLFALFLGRCEIDDDDDVADATSRRRRDKRRERERALYFLVDIFFFNRQT